MGCLPWPPDLKEEAASGSAAPDMAQDLVSFRALPMWSMKMNPRRHRLS